MHERGASPRYTAERTVARERPARERWREAMELRRRIGRLGLALEDALTMKPGESRLDKLDQHPLVDFEGLPQRTRQAVANILEEFRVAQKFLNSDLQYLASRYHDTSKKRAPEVRGGGLFLAKVGSRPTGNVILEEREGFLVLTFSDKSDFTMFSERPRAIGLHVAQEQLGKAGRARHPWWLESTLLLIDGSPSTKRKFDSASIYAHERQHFINHRLLGLFDETEAFSTMDEGMLGNEEEWPRFVKEGDDEYVDRQMKDEVLAMFREGAPVEARWAERLLNNDDCYPFTKALSEDRREAVRKMLHDLESWASRHGLFENERRRAFFVHQLYDVPFDAMLRHLKSAQKYFQEKAAELVDREWAQMLEESMHKHHAWKAQGLEPVRARAWQARQVFLDFTMGLSPKKSDGTLWSGEELRDEWEEAVFAVEEQARSVRERLSHMRDRVQGQNGIHP